MLCNRCFRETYQRFKVYQLDGVHELPSNVTHVEVSVLQSRMETVESVLRDLGMNPDHYTWDGKSY